MPCSEQVLRASWHHEIPLELTGSRVSATAGACKAMVRDAGTDRPPASSSCEVPAPPLGRGLVRRFGVWFCFRSGSSQQLREHLWQMAPMGCSLPAQTGSEHMMGSGSCLGSQDSLGHCFSPCKWPLPATWTGQAFLGEHVSCSDLADVHSRSGSCPLSPWKLC